MVGTAVLMAAVNSPLVEEILLIVRNHPTGPGLPNATKIKTLVVPDLMKIDSTQIDGRWNAAVFAIGKTSAGMSEAEYTQFTFDLTKHCADTLHSVNPSLKFIYISGAGADATEHGKTMWARVRGKTENMILNRGFKDAYVIRPAIIIPEDGIKSKTTSYRIFYDVTKPILPWARRLFPKQITTSRRLAGRIISLLNEGSSLKRLENHEI